LKSDYGIFLGYSETSKEFRVYNSITLVIEEVIHIRFDKNKHDKELSKLDGSCADLRLDNSFIATSLLRHEPWIVASIQQEA